MKTFTDSDIVKALGLPGQRGAPTGGLAFLGMLAAGVLLGAGLGLLLAPQTGRDLRQSIAESMTRQRQRFLREAVAEGETLAAH